MKIAVASQGKYVSTHFGHCEGFTFYELDEDKVVKKYFKENPGHRPGFLPDFLKDLGVNLVICGGMGQTAQQLFAQNSIEVIVGAEGHCDNVILKYLKNELESTGRVCREHEFEGHCHE
mgnify:CR=1 FL=1